MFCLKYGALCNRSDLPILVVAIQSIKRMAMMNLLNFWQSAIFRHLSLFLCDYFLLRFLPPNKPRFQLGLVHSKRSSFRS